MGALMLDVGAERALHSPKQTLHARQQEAEEL